MQCSLPKEARPRLIYILGWGRSGSSVLANVLGSLEGGASLGEMRYLWDRGLLENGICGCGSAFASCPFWQDLIFGGCHLGEFRKADAQALIRRIGSRARAAQILALTSEFALNAYIRRNRHELADLMDLYVSAFRTSGARFLLDSSKSPFYAVNLLFPKRPFDVTFLHLVRDPRGVLYSWKRKKSRKDHVDAKEFPRYSSVRSLLQWSFENSYCEYFERVSADRYIQVCYEDFVKDWRGVLQRALPECFSSSEATYPSKLNVATVHTQHSISGNPSRFITGEVALIPDLAWRNAISGFDQRLAELLCARVAKHYGYDLRPVSS